MARKKKPAKRRATRKPVEARQRLPKGYTIQEIQSLIWNTHQFDETHETMRRQMIQTRQDYNALCDAAERAEQRAARLRVAFRNILTDLDL